MRSIDIYNIKRAVRFGQLEFFVRKGDIYVNDAQSGECIKIGSAKGEVSDDIQELEE